MNAFIGLGKKRGEHAGADSGTFPEAGRTKWYQEVSSRLEGVRGSKNGQSAGKGVGTRNHKRCWQ